MMRFQTATAVFVLPVLFGLFYVARFFIQTVPSDEQFHWCQWAILITMITLERFYAYGRTVSQRHVLARDISCTLTNLYLTVGVAVAILAPMVAYLVSMVLKRKLLFASPAELGPLWVQVPAILLLVSFLRYWAHRLQHEVPFLWDFHSYHHRVTDMQAMNGFVSHPIDFAFRNVFAFVLLDVVGFDPSAILIAAPATMVSSAFAHCGADVKGGCLSYALVTPEVHRWHHSATVPAGHRYAVNYGVEFSVWDILFGTFHLPHKAGMTEQPERIGHPEGLPDERNYIKFLLEPLGCYTPLGKRMPLKKETAKQSD